MRFERIDLDRYGCFTGQKITFGPAASNGDFHIVYGPNEAGKSTLRDACIDFLYGFPNKTTYNFLHNYEALQLGAAISTASAAYEGRRIKRQSNNFLGMDDNTTTDAGIRAVIGDVTRDGFEQMFSLNDASLEKGCEGILRSEGDLGTLLFSAVSGLSSFHERLSTIQEKADGFYKKSARLSRLQELNQKLNDIKAQLSNLDIHAGAYEKMKEEEKSTRTRYDEAKSVRDQKNRRINELKAILAAIDPWHELQKFETQLLQMKDVPGVPEGWLAEAEELVRAEATAQAALTESARAQRNSKDVLGTIVSDAIALQIAAAVRRLSEDMVEARFRTASDIESRRLELQNIDDRIKARVVRLNPSEAAEPQKLLLPVAATGRLRELTEQRGGLAAAEALARKEWDAAEEEREAAETAAITETGEFRDLSALAETVNTLRDKEEIKAYEEAATQCKTLKADLEILVSGLSPWKGNRDALLASPPVDLAHVQRLKTTARKLEAERSSLEKEIERSTGDQARLKAEIDTLTKASGVIDDETARNVRAARTAAWNTHRGVFDTDLPLNIEALRESASSFEATMTEDDKIGEARLSRSSDLAALRLAQVGHAKCQADLVQSARKLDTLQINEVAHRKAVAALFASMGLPEETALDSMEVWLERKEKALSKARELARIEQSRDEIKVRYDAIIQTMDNAMQENGLNPVGLDWRQKLKSCDKMLSDWQEQARKKKAADETQKKAVTTSKRRLQAHQRAQEALQQWETGWTDELASTWIGNKTPVVVKEILKELDALSGELADADKLRSRIEAMTADRSVYQEEVKRLADSADEHYDNDDPLGVAEHLRARVAAAEEDERTRKTRQKELDNATQRCREAQEEVDKIAMRVDEMRAVIPADDLKVLIIQMRRSEEKQRLETDIAQLEDTLRKCFGEESITIIRAKLEALGEVPQALENFQLELDELNRSKADEEQHLSTLFHEWKTAENKLTSIGTDDEAVRLEEQRQALLLEIEQEAHAFMQLSAGVMLVNKALSTYRETHRSSMMEQANAAFIRMTRGAFQGLAAAPGKDSEVLVGIRADGSSIIASEMSRGTRFQLYLALRVAGYAEFAKHRETLPFFADDIFEPFDDERSAETFGILHEMSKHGQVVYLTHHRHLCDIAKSVCGNDVKIHELPARMIANTLAASQDRDLILPAA